MLGKVPHLSTLKKRKKIINNRVSRKENEKPG
jgi:hypothetical protein